MGVVKRPHQPRVHGGGGNCSQQGELRGALTPYTWSLGSAGITSALSPLGLADPTVAGTRWGCGEMSLELGAGLLE